MSKIINQDTSRSEITENTNDELRKDDSISPNATYTINDLFHAVSNSDNKLLQTILDTGLSADSRNKFGNAPLYIAAMKGNVEVVTMLVRAKATIDVVSEDENIGTALHAALLNDHLSVAQYLLVKGANVNAADSSGVKPVHIAAGRGNLAMLNLLKECNCDVNVLDNNNDTPAHSAAIGITKGVISGWDAINWLIKNGLDISLINEADNSIEDILDSSQCSYGTEEYTALIEALHPY